MEAEFSANLVLQQFLNLSFRYLPSSGEIKVQDNPDILALCMEVPKWLLKIEYVHLHGFMLILNVTIYNQCAHHSPTRELP